MARTQQEGPCRTVLAYRPAAPSSPHIIRTRISCDLLLLVARRVLWRSVAGGMGFAPLCWSALVLVRRDLVDGPRWYWAVNGARFRTCAAHEVHMRIFSVPGVFFTFFFQ